jgi:hypothetical protein
MSLFATQVKGHSMADENKSEQSPKPRNPDQDLELWKYYAGAGGADKNTMVTVTSLLLGFSITIISYIVAQLITFNPILIKEPTKVLSLAILGLIISCLTVYVALLYGGYSNENWARADDIARRLKEKYGWNDLLPNMQKKKKNGFKLPFFPSH